MITISKFKLEFSIAPETQIGVVVKGQSLLSMVPSFASSTEIFNVS